MKYHVAINDDSKESIVHNMTWYLTEKAGYRVAHTLCPNSIWDIGRDVMEETALGGG